MGKALTIVLIVLLVIAICICGYFIIPQLLGGNAAITTSTGGGSGSGLSFDENAGAYQEQITIAKQGVEVPGWSSITIPANSAEVTVDFYNPEGNEGLYYMTFELRLADGESLYQSGLVKAGQHIQKITLSRGLPAGTYDAVVHIQPYTADEAMSATNNADMKVKLIAA